MNWNEWGILEREIAIYEQLATRFDTVYIVTYGTNDKTLQSELPDDVVVIEKSVIRNNFLYSLCIPLIHRDLFREVDIVKTNQMKGSWSAVLVKYLFETILVVRTGYVLTQFAEYRDDADWKQIMYGLIERIAYQAADGIVTSSPSGQRYVEQRYQPSATHQFVPNYIDAEKFRPMQEVNQRGGICTVARIDEQKNLYALIDAAETLETRLTIAGDGPLRNKLTAYAERSDTTVEFLGRIENNRVPKVVNEHDVFVLPSHYEGMPKALLEAMSCGVAVVGTDVPGIRDIISDGQDGLLCGTSSDALHSKIQTALTDPDLRDELGEAARRTIESEYTLSVVTSSELQLYTQLSKECNHD
jgi:glycosyltransferase involved in cell wall biosynthesis